MSGTEAGSEQERAVHSQDAPLALDEIMSLVSELSQRVVAPAEEVRCVLMLFWLFILYSRF